MYTTEALSDVEVESTRRRARALTPWLAADVLSGLTGGASDASFVLDARNALRGRSTDVDQDGLVEPWPASLEAHAAALRAGGSAQAMFDEGWELAVIADLRRVVAAQPTVFIDQEAGEGSALSGADLASVARLTLPLGDPSAPIPARFDAEQQAWIITSTNPNLRVTGTFGGEVEPNVLGFGFTVRLLASFMSVAEVGGRYILRDGYHRAYQLLSAGIVRAPVFLRRFGADGEFCFRQGMLPAAVYGGEYPPMLADYGDDSVAEEIWLAPAETTLLVHATARLAERS
jgi:hypothetical protein